MTKFKKWLYDRFLPAWCRDDLLRQNELLTAQCKAQQREIERLRAHIEGAQAASRRNQPRITINCKEVSRT